ncbi:MAG: class I SAM-dependent methyltransferase [Alphaproteobacteria bacterium]|nr:class I SAM-dependent methyltransferase [Alphaproteobacteria bacterium]
MNRISGELFKDLPGRSGVPLFAAMIAQGAGAMATFGLSFAVEYAFGDPLPIMLVLTGQGVAAAVIGTRFGLARWWIPINLALPPLAGLILTLRLPGWLYLAAFALLILFYWNATRGQVPLYLSSRRAKEELLRLLPVKPDIRFADLGSGFGGMVLWLASRRREGDFLGIESAPFPFAISWLRTTFAGLPHAHITYGDFKNSDLGGFDVVYTFLSPVPMTDLFSKARAEMKPGSLFVSNTFEVPGETPNQVVELGDWRGGRLFIWRM